jgi:hypothetical protein
VLLIDVPASVPAARVGNKGWKMLPARRAAIARGRIFRGGLLDFGVSWGIGVVFSFCIISRKEDRHPPAEMGSG